MEERFDNSHDSNPLSEGRSKKEGKKGVKKIGEESRSTEVAGCC
jgi:hypothetical protein